MGVSASGVLCARVRRGIERPWRAPPRAHRGMHATADACTVEAWVGVGVVDDDREYSLEESAVFFAAFVTVNLDSSGKTTVLSAEPSLQRRLAIIRPVGGRVGSRCGAARHGQVAVRGSAGDGVGLGAGQWT